MQKEQRSHIIAKADRNVTPVGERQSPAACALEAKHEVQTGPRRYRRCWIIHNATQRSDADKSAAATLKLHLIFFYCKVKKKQPRCSERDNECVCIVWARRGTAAINAACPSRGGKGRVSDHRGINLNLITQLPSEPEPRCVRALPRYVLHSNRTDLLILNKNVETKYWKGKTVNL